MSLINERLLTAAEMLRQSESVADIGTDHALLPIHIIKKGIAQRVIACDIATGPLEVAKKNIEKYNLSEKIELRLADGLKGLREKECNQITVLGMGGETIASIIEDTPWVKSPDVSLILQPMSCDDRLRSYLSEKGFNIVREKAVLSQGRIYTIIQAVYTGQTNSFPPHFAYVGRLLEAEGEELATNITYAVKHFKSMKKCLIDIQGVDRRKDLYEKLSKAVPALENDIEQAKARI